MATTSPARTTKKTPAKKKDFDDVKLVRWDDSGEEFTASIFDAEEFTFSTDVNAYLLLNASRDVAGGGFLDLMDSLVVVDTTEADTDREIDEVTKTERDRFHDLLKAQKNLSVERLAKFIADLMEIAGNEDGDSSSTD
jgi:hypothetical protein